MIKLESKSPGLSAVAEIRVQSSSDDASVTLTTDEVRVNVNNAWQTDAAHRKQIVTFLSPDGPVQLVGEVLESCAVEVPACWAIVAEVELSTKALPAFQAGRVSRSLVALEVRRVVEVWSSPEKLLWRAADRTSGPAAAAGKVMGPDGKISKAA
jgi:hypothetical protein